MPSLNEQGNFLYVTLRVEQSYESRPVNGTNQFTDWQKKLLEKQQEVIQWSMQHNVVVSPELVQLWDQAMTLGEEKGKRVYEEFLDEWEKFKKNPPKEPVHREPTDWQKELLLKQQEITTIAHEKNITLPRELVNLWEKAINSEEKEGRKTYDEFLRKWEKLEKKHSIPKDEPLAGQYVDITNQGNNHRPSYQQQTNYQRQYNVPYNQRNNNPYGQYYANTNRRPNYNYNPYQEQYPYQYQRPYREPFAGQQLNEWQNALLDLGEEISQWAEETGKEVPLDIVIGWETAMHTGRKEDYEYLMLIWDKTIENQANYQSSGTDRGASDSAKRNWKTALLNQIEGQNIISLMLGLNLVNEIKDLRDKAYNIDKSNLKDLINSLMDTWNKINVMISKDSQR